MIMAGKLLRVVVAEIFSIINKTFEGFPLGKKIGNTTNKSQHINQFLFFKTFLNFFL